MKNSKIPETAQNFQTETWISQKFQDSSDFLDKENQEKFTPQIVILLKVMI